ncbi:protein FAM178B-like [Rhizophagus clarus]|uniref:Protein FAM178B-like n=1 Tax=Rhizophagus clarus TaxID=94130 RepID=A0A8H3M9W9_9GLOM|nr:protein FAM178B-like [Rhizophagus clarus]
MVKQKTSARVSLFTPPITNYFPRTQNNNTNSESSTMVSNKYDSENYLYKVNNQNETIIISDDDDDVSKSVPDVIEDDEIDHILSKSEKSSKSIKNNLRRSKRSRRVVFQEGFVPTVNAVPIKGDIPIFDDSSSPSTKENYTAIPSYQNSLSALLREKRIRDKAGYNINVLEKVLEDNMIDELEDLFDNYDRLKISAAILDEDEKLEHLQQILEETDKFDQGHQIEFFGNLSSNPQIPSLQTVVLNNDPTFDLLLKMYSEEDKLKDILCNNWITRQFEIGWRLPTEVIVWILHMASYGENKVITEASFNTLKNIAEVKGIYSSSLKNEPGDINVSFIEIYNILTTLGASNQMISTQYCLEQIITRIPILEAPPKFSYIDNVRQLLKILVPMIDNRLLAFSSPEEIRSAIIVFLRLPLDKRLLSLSSEIEEVLNSLLEIFEEDQWIEQTKLICDDVEFSCGSVTQFKVAMLEHLPISDRGRSLRRFLAFRFLFGSKSTFSQQKSIHDVTEPEISEILNSLLDLFLTVFKIRDETNYADLYNYVLFLDYALDDESQLRKAKDTVEEIANRLNYLHGRIVDMRAAFMERTKAKDLIQRLYMRLYYISKHRRGKVQAISIICEISLTDDVRLTF